MQSAYKLSGGAQTFGQCNGAGNSEQALQTA